MWSFKIRLPPDNEKASLFAGGRVVCLENSESKSEWVRKEIRKYVRNKSLERELVAKLIYKDWLFSHINKIERLFLFTIAIKIAKNKCIWSILRYLWNYSFKSSHAVRRILHNPILSLTSGERNWESRRKMASSFNILS